jgi:small subunit ribosomal protein S12
MPTINQLVKQKRISRIRKKNYILGGAPQRSGTCIKVYTTSPKKPNSANRAVAKVSLSCGSRKYHKKNNLKKETIAYIPYEGHNLKIHSSGLIQGGKKVDTPGVRVKFCPGVRDLQGVLKSRQGRSRKGNKKPATSNK